MKVLFELHGANTQTHFPLQLIPSISVFPFIFCIHVRSQSCFVPGSGTILLPGAAL